MLTETPVSSWLSTEEKASKSVNVHFKLLGTYRTRKKFAGVVG